MQPQDSGIFLKTIWDTFYIETNVLVLWNKMQTLYELLGKKGQTLKKFKSCSWPSLATLPSSSWLLVYSQESFKNPSRMWKLLNKLVSTVINIINHLLFHLHHSLSLHIPSTFLSPLNAPMLFTPLKKHVFYKHIIKFHLSRLGFKSWVFHGGLENHTTFPLTHPL